MAFPVTNSLAESSDGEARNASVATARFSPTPSSPDARQIAAAAVHPLHRCAFVVSALGPIRFG